MKNYTNEELQRIISGAIFDFAAYLTTREEVIEVGSSVEASSMVKLITEWAKLRNLNYHDADVKNWGNNIK